MNVGPVLLLAQLVECKLMAFVILFLFAAIAERMKNWTYCEVWKLLVGHLGERLLGQGLLRKDSLQEFCKRKAEGANC